MSRSHVRPFVIVTVVAAAMVGVLALLVIPIRITYGAGSMRCGTVADSAGCPAQLAMNQLRATGVFVAALIVPALALFAHRGEGRFWALVRLAWVSFLVLYWVVVLPLGLFWLALAESAER